MSEGKLEYILTKETKVNIQVSDIINELAHIVDNKLADYYLYQEKPYIDTSSGEEYVEITLHGNDECESGSPVEWKPLFAKAIKRYAQDIADGIEERGPEE